MSGLKSADVLESIVSSYEGRTMFFDMIYSQYVSRMPDGSRMANMATCRKILGSHPQIKVNKQAGQGCITEVISYQSIDITPPTITITETRYVDKIEYRKQWEWAPYSALFTLVILGAIAGYFMRGF